MRWITHKMYSLMACAIIMVLCSCNTPHNIEASRDIDYSGDLQLMQSRMDSLMYNMLLLRKETSERLSNLKIEHKTVYYSQPDDAGKQYPTQISETHVNKEDKESITTDTQLNVTIKQLAADVTELRHKLDAMISESEKVQEVSWWQLYKTDVYAMVFALIIVGWLVYKKLNK